MKKILVVLLLIAVLFIGGCLGTYEPKKTGTLASPKSGKIYLKVGESAENEYLKVTVISVEKTNLYEYYSETWGEILEKEPKSGNFFVLSEVEVENVGDEKEFANRRDFNIMDSEGYKYDTTKYYGDDELNENAILPGQRTKGKIIFEIPKNVIRLKMVYDFGGFSEANLVYWLI